MREGLDAFQASARAQATSRAEMIRPLAAAGLTGAQIAGYLEMTRGQVAGICSRHGIKLGTRRTALSRPAVAGTGGACRFPLWAHDARPDHRYCGKRATAPGRPYCSEHEAVCYQKIAAAEAA